MEIKINQKRKKLEMRIRNFIRLVTILPLACGSLSALSDQASFPYLDNNGYCVLNINPSDKVRYAQQQVIKVPDAKGHVLRIHELHQTIVSVTRTTS